MKGHVQLGQGMIGETVEKCDDRSQWMSRLSPRRK